MKTCLVNLYDLDPPHNGGMSRIAFLVSRMLAEYDELGHAKVFFAVGWRYNTQFREWLGHSGGMLIPVLPEVDQTPLLNSLKPDIAINPLFGMSPIANWNGYTGIVNVASMPDALALDKPYLFSEANLRYRRAIYDQLKKTNLVVTISDHARSRLMHHLDLNEEQIVVIPLAGDDLQSGVTAAPYFGSQNQNIPSSPYVLYPANGWPHKRHELLLRVMKHIWKSRSDISLVLTGWRSPGYIAELAARHGCPVDKIIDLGYVNDEAMISLYRNAEALVFVSEYEGFCMPLLEAMMNDCPVICAPVASLPEVAGNAALYVDSTNPLDWSNTFLNELPIRRAELIEKGRIKAGKYSWERTKQKWASTLLRLGFVPASGQKDFSRSLNVPESVVSSEFQIWAKQHAIFQEGIDEKEKVIHEKEKVIHEKEKVIHEKEKVIHEKEKIFHEKLDAKESDLAFLKNELIADQEIIQSFRSSFRFWILHGPLKRIVPLFLLSWGLNLRDYFLPKLGVLTQHPPRPLQIPARYQKGPGLLDDKLPVISFVTPSYNQAVFLERTIQSVLSQNYPKLEYVIQDGKSTDGTVAVIEKYQDKLTHAESIKDGGQANAINWGFKHTTGAIMAYLNSDDVLLPGSLNYVAEYFARYPDVDVIYSHRVIINEKDEEVGRWILPPHDNEIILWADYVPQETLFWRRSLWEKAGNQMDESYQFALDWDLILRFRAAGAKFVRVPRFLAAFRVHTAQKTSAHMESSGLKEMNRLRKQFHERDIGWEEILKKTIPYLRRSIIYHKLYRLGIIRY